jgi:hypothetical protein
MLRLIAASLPAARRADRLEEWLADLEGSRELGLSRRTVVLGALRLGLTENRVARLRPRTWLVGGAAALGIIVLGVPTVAIGGTIVDSARGVVTVERSADGTEQAVSWRDYPGVGGADPAEALTGPTAEQGVRLGEAITAEIRAALDLDWTEEDGGQVYFPAENRYGGLSMLVTVNTPAWLSATAPQDAERAMDVVRGILDRHGFTAPVLVHDDAKTTSGLAAGPAGQWVSFTWSSASVVVSYGANALLPAADRAEFERRLAPFLPYAQPAPLAS